MKMNSMEEIHTKGHDNTSDSESHMKQLSREFVEHCGLHGINKINSAKGNNYRRIAWLILILGSAGYLSYTVISELRIYYTYPTTTRVRVLKSQKMDFPAVTICNLSPYNKSKLPNNQEYFKYIMAFQDIWSYYAEPTNSSDEFYQSRDFTDPVSPETMKNVSMEAEKMFTFCKFDGWGFNCTDYIKPILTDIGLCYTFNKDGQLKTYRAGANYNLRLQVFIDSSNYFFGVSLGSGVKILVHDPRDFPFMRTGGFVAGTGVDVMASVKSKVIKNLPYPYKSSNNDYCVDIESPDFKNPLKHLNYSWIGCRTECTTDYLRGASGCTVPTFDGVEPPYCALANYSKYYSEVVKVFLDPAFDKNCSDKCKEPCSTKQYDTQISYSSFPSSFTSELVLELFNITEEFVRNNVLQVNIFLESLETTYYEQTALYTSVGNVLANVGGQMGLFLGASLLTLTEIMEFIVTLVIHSLNKNIPKNKNSTSVK